MNIATLPIQFRRVVAGNYVSVKGDSCKEGEYRIRKDNKRTEWTRGKVPSRWHVMHVPTDRVIDCPYTPGPSSTLEAAIRMLHDQLCHGLCRGFAVLAEINTAAERAAEASERRAELERKIRRSIMNGGAWADRLMISQNDIVDMARDIADVIDGTKP